MIQTRRAILWIFVACLMAAATRADCGTILQLSAPLAPDEVISDFDISPDGHTAIYMTARVIERHSNGGATWRYNSIYSVPVSGGPARKLNRPQFDDAALSGYNDSQRVFTSDGRSMIFSGIQEESGQVHIYLASLDGSSLVRLTDDYSSTGYIQHYLTPNGSDVVFLDSLFGGTLGSVPITGGPTTTLYSVSDPRAVIGPSQSSPDSSRIVFRAGKYGDLDTFSIRPDGSGLVKLVDNGTGDWETISPDGQTVVFSTRTNPSTPTDSQFFTVPIEGGPAAQLSSLLTVGSARFATTTTGEQAVIFSGRSGPEKSYQLHLVPLSGGPSLQLTPALSPGEHLQYQTMTADGRYVIYSIASVTEGSVGVYRTSLNDGSVLKLSQDLPIGSFVGGVVLSPDETQLLYMAAVGNGDYNNLFSVSINGTNHHQIIPQPEPGPRIEDYYFSADGSYLAYQLSPEVGGDELYLMPSSGGSSVRISPDPDNSGFGVENFRVVGNWAIYTLGDSLDERFLYAVQIPEPHTSVLGIAAALYLLCGIRCRLPIHSPERIGVAA